MQTTLYTILSFVVLLGVLVFIHELGHFLVAKKVGIRVDRFSLGFPPNIFSRKWGETEYSIGMIPLGGYVKMAGEGPEEEATGKDDEFSSKKVWQRFLVILAGPFMNYILAIFVTSGLLFAYGIPTTSQDEATIGRVAPDQPAAVAGLQADDIVIAIDGSPVKNFEAMREIVRPSGGKSLHFTWLRGSDTISADVVPVASPTAGPDGIVDTVGLVGVMAKEIYPGGMGFFESAALGFKATNRMIWQILLFVKNLIVGNVAANSVGGPIYIAQQSAAAAQQGLFAFLQLMAVLSVNLAVLNVLPIPVLDGGHMVFLALEKIKGSPVTMKARIIAQQAGMFFLLGYILFVSWNDVIRWLG